jgi:YgiT-type zinc finger domain-containing protein
VAMIRQIEFCRVKSQCSSPLIPLQNDGLSIVETVQYVYKRNGHFLIVDNVPCEQCEFCGEQYFEASVLKKIEADADAVYSHKKKPDREMLVPVENFV